MNERVTENIVRDKFWPYNGNGFIVEEQQSKNPRINNLLKNASKSGSGKGYPEFIVQSEEDSNFLLTVECKADKNFGKYRMINKWLSKRMYVTK